VGKTIPTTSTDSSGSAPRTTATDEATEAAIEEATRSWMNAAFIHI
jgi:hypothetical protein